MYSFVVWRSLRAIGDRKSRNTGRYWTEVTTGHLRRTLQNLRSISFSGSNRSGQRPRRVMETDMKERRERVTVCMYVFPRNRRFFFTLVRSSDWSVPRWYPIKLYSLSTQFSLSFVCVISNAFSFELTAEMNSMSIARTSPTI